MSEKEKQAFLEALKDPDTRQRIIEILQGAGLLDT